MSIYSGFPQRGTEDLSKEEFLKVSARSRTFMWEVASLGLPIFDVRGSDDQKSSHFG